MTDKGVHFLDAKGPEGMRLYAIGDVHGRLDLLEAMLAGIDAELARDNPADWRIIFLGDYVDRGPDSRGVLQFLIDRQSRDPRLVTLTGNHDAGFVDFLERPDPAGLFMRFGGQQTAQSYGVTLVRAYGHGIAEGRKGFLESHAALKAAVPGEHLAFLRNLRRSFSAGDFFFCHAGIRPRVPLERQDPDDLIWIRNEFLDYTALHPKVIVHGHTPTPEPELLPNRVNIDTLAYDTGRLTGLVIDGVDKRILAVQA